MCVLGQVIEVSQSLSFPICKMKTMVTAAECGVEDEVSAGKHQPGPRCGITKVLAVVMETKAGRKKMGVLEAQIALGSPPSPSSEL